MGSVLHPPSSARPAQRRATKPVRAALLAAALLAACGDGGGRVEMRAAMKPGGSPGSGSGDLAKLEDVLRWKGDLTLEENREVINVDPRATVTPDGRLVVADAKERQLRLYTPNGRLIRTLGRSGAGPGEFSNPQVAFRTADGGVAAADFPGRLTFFDSAGAVLRVDRPEVRPVFDAHALPGGRILLAGRRPGARETPLLHVWDPASGTVVRSFFTIPVREGLEDESVVYGWVSADVRGDTIAAVSTLSDSVYLFRSDGEPLGKVRVPSPHLRPMRDGLSQRAGRQEILDFAATYSFLTHVFWTGGGKLLVQYADVEGNEQKWRLVSMTDRGERLYELRDTPRLLAASDDGRRLFFVKDASLAPNLWAVAEPVR